MRKKSVWKFIFLLIACVGMGASGLKAQDTLRVMTYNILRYGAIGINCTPISPTSRNDWFKRVMIETQPDIFGVNEIGPFDNAVSPAVNISLNVLPFVPGKGAFYEAAQINFDGNQDICNMMFYNSQKLGLSQQAFVNVSGTLRNLDYYKFYYKSPGTITDSTFLHVILVHFMSNNNSGQVVQATAAMNYLQNISGGSSDNYIVMGDMNMDSPNDDAWEEMHLHSNANIRIHDPLNLSTWTGNSSDYVWSQSTSTSSANCRAGGGLNDRFDIIGCSNAIMNGTEGMTYITGSHWVPGNPHAPNPSVSGSVNSGLVGMSDHFPVVIDLLVDQSVGLGQAAHPIKHWFESPFSGAIRGGLQIPGGLAGEYEIRVYDLQGRELFLEKRFYQAGSHQLSIDLEQNNGVFLVEITGEHINPLVNKVVRLR